MTERNLRLVASALVLWLVMLLSASAANDARDRPGSALDILTKARAVAAKDCGATSEALLRVLCSGQLRVGLRTYYPGFSVRGTDGTFSGFEVDIANSIADFLGVRMVPVAVDPKTRIPLVAAGDIDLTIATMGHTVQRDAEVRFIRPQYYESHSVVVGPKDRQVKDWDDLVGQTVCLPSGASSNIAFVRHHIRILTFDRPEQLLDALSFGECAFVTHDNTLFAEPLRQPRFAGFEVKFGFASMPWGMAVARSGATQLADLLDDLSAQYHADGTFLRLARQNGLDVSFLLDEQRRWTTARCTPGDNVPQANCLIAPVDTSDANDTSAVAAQVAWVERTAAAWGLRLDLSLLKHDSTIALLVEGVGYSLALIIGALSATLAFSLLFGWLLGYGPMLVRGVVAALTAIGQRSPLPLLLFFGYVVAGGVTQYSGPVALFAAVIVIGFFNGANAGRAIGEAVRVERGRSFLTAVSVSGIQLLSFLVNAAKGSPAAAMIGVPEFLNVMTDLTAYSRDRVMVFLTLLAFYVVLVLIVIMLLARVETRLARFARVRRWQM